MQSKSPRRPYIRAVRREISPPQPKRTARRWGPRSRAALLLAVLAGGGWYFWQQARAPRALPVVAVRVGAVEEALEVDALIVRKEQVVTAPVAGRIRRLASEGERVRVGAAVVEIAPGDVPAEQTQPAAPAASPPANSAAAAARREYDQLSVEIFRLTAALNEAKYGGEIGKAAELQEEADQLARRQIALLDQLQQPESSGGAAPRQSGAGAPSDATTEPAGGATPVVTQVAGVVLYQVDGLESMLTLADAERWRPSWIRSLPYPEMARTSEQGAAVGQPLFRVVDDLDLDLIVVVPASRLTPSQRTIMAQDGLTLRLPGSDRAVTARVRRMVEEGEELLVHLTTPLPSPEALRVRRMRINLLLETFEGTVVPRSAIDVREGRTGVWVAAGSTYRFVAVRVVGGNREEVAVTGELAPDSRVLKELTALVP